MKFLSKFLPIKNNLTRDDYDKYYEELLQMWVNSEPLLHSQKDKVDRYLGKGSYDESIQYFSRHCDVFEFIDIEYLEDKLIEIKDDHNTSVGLASWDKDYNSIYGFGHTSTWSTMSTPIKYLCPEYLSILGIRKRLRGRLFLKYPYGKKILNNFVPIVYIEIYGEDINYTHSKKCILEYIKSIESYLPRINIIEHSSIGNHVCRFVLELFDF